METLSAILSSPLKGALSRACHERAGQPRETICVEGTWHLSWLHSGTRPWHVGSLPLWWKLIPCFKNSKIFEDPPPAPPPSHYLLEKYGNKVPLTAIPVVIKTMIKELPG